MEIKVEKTKFKKKWCKPKFFTLNIKKTGGGPVESYTEDSRYNDPFASP